MNQELQELTESLQVQLAVAQQQAELQAEQLKQQQGQQQPREQAGEDGSSSSLVSELQAQLAAAQQSSKAKLGQQHQEAVTALEEELEQVGRGSAGSASPAAAAVECWLRAGSNSSACLGGMLALPLAVPRVLFACWLQVPETAARRLTFPYTWQPAPLWH